MTDVFTKGNLYILNNSDRVYYEYKGLVREYFKMGVAPIASSANGAIWRYSTAPPTQRHIIVKIERGTISGDAEVIRKLQRLDPEPYCGEIHARVIGKIGFDTFILLEAMINDLRPHHFDIKDFVRQSGIATPNEAWCYIVEEIRKQMVCLYNKDNSFVYTDLKPGNVLYKLEGKQYVFKLGDLGSMYQNVAESKNQYISTYPCLPENGESIGLRSFIDAKQKEECLAYQLGILLAALILPKIIGHLHYTEIRKRSDAGTVRIIDAFHRKLVQQVGERIGSLLHPDPAKRLHVLTESLFTGKAYWKHHKRLTGFYRKKSGIRKHQGIIQTGRNKGKLRPGYRYSGLKAKNGLPQIIKAK